ncbi:TrmB family transcriptional regulator [Streptomyces sp. NPDC001984]
MVAPFPDTETESMTPVSRSVQTLVELGFSQYEARTYAGLVGQPPMTGYAVSKATKVPQPKVYETLGRLAERGVVVQVGSDPARWAAIPPRQLIAHLDNDFKRRLTSAELHLSRLDSDSSSNGVVRPYLELRSLPDVYDAAKKLVMAAKGRIYLSGHADQLAELSTVIADADRREVHIDVLSFGEPPITLKHGTVNRHRSTDGTVYPHHQARFVALVVDSGATVWALARNGRDWTGIWTEHDDLLPAAVKGYVTHDIWTQRIFNDFKDELQTAYGPSLQRLVNPVFTDEAMEDSTVRDLTRRNNAAAS